MTPRHAAQIESLPLRTPLSGGPQMTATVFKIAAMVVLVGGTIAALALILFGGSDNHAGVIVGLCVEGGAVLTAVGSAFLGYTLELLISIRNSTDVLAGLALLDDDEE